MHDVHEKEPFESRPSAVRGRLARCVPSSIPACAIALAAILAVACGPTGKRNEDDGETRPKPENRIPESSTSAFPQAFVSVGGDVVVFLEGGGVYTGLPRTGVLAASPCPLVTASTARCGSLATGVVGRGSATVKWTKGAGEGTAATTFAFSESGVSFVWDGVTYTRSRVPKENELTGTFEAEGQSLVLYADGHFDSRGLEVFDASVSGSNPRARKVVGKWSVSAGSLVLVPAYGERRTLAMLLVPGVEGASSLARVAIGDVVFERK